MLTLNRPTFCSLTGVDHATLGNMIRRGQVPFRVDQKASGRGYLPHEAYLMLTARALASTHRIELTRSAEIAGCLPAVLQPVWAEIGRTGQLLAATPDHPVAQIMAGRAERAGLQPIAIAGTDRAIDASLRKVEGVVIGSVRINATQVAVQLIQRADHHGVEIGADFWTGPFEYRPREQLTTADQAGTGQR